MNRGRAFHVIASVSLVVLLASCATTHVPPISAMGAAYQPERDEKRLWQQARNEEKKLRENVAIYDDPLLVDYLQGVVNRLTPAGMAANPYIRYRVTVIEDPTLNAFAYPHGSLYIHTGLLARMENEAELATVLGHEMTHVENRHMLRYQRSIRNKQIGFTVAAIAGAMIIASKEGKAVREGHYGKAARIRVLSDVLIGLGLQLAVLAAVNGYGRDLEREADDGGFAKLLASGYDLGQAPKVYEALEKEHGDPGKAEVFFFGNHPRLAERIQDANGYIQAHPAVAGGKRYVGEKPFLQRARPVIRDDARLNIEMGRLELAEYELNRVLPMLPEDPEVHTLFGKLRLAQAEKAQDPQRTRDLEDQALDAFREAVRLDPDRPEPHREIGLISYRNGELDTACVAFRQYVELAPNAEDASRIRDYLLELKRGGHCP